ncbi:LysR family transcriptional regulator [Polymorphobacter sp. PAMC 29334]|uniref:LysR substrate-binding domain-containing protein n=1 Tax=Polymorphobacter sp. PAMC 29334 TaxID=2862331 RepID=UPI001C797904|nr:LysR substrate-binding domain-containing protein [Polymorphobacter sp. PAMC 29334]QYE34570.1 LysR family transcriptional regulator [Polymorphobacter sp. PAMC 29334]
MVQRLPPLRAIEAFVLVAESLSFTKAAGELNITKSAISRRIQSLEEDLEVQLFIRGNKALMLTPDGETYYKLTGPAFGSLRAAGAQLKRTRQANTLCVALPQSFASYWLLPRVASFYEQYPNTELRLDSLGYFNLLESEAIDVVLQVAKEPPPGFHAERLLSLELFPVCSPTLLSRHPAVLNEIADHRLLHLNTMPSIWAEWLQLVGRPDLLEGRGHRYDTFSLALDAAVNGLGLTIGTDIICHRDLQKGRLVAPFPQRLVSARSMYFVCRKRDVDKPMVRRFRS